MNNHPPLNGETGTVQCTDRGSIEGYQTMSNSDEQRMSDQIIDRLLEIRDQISRHNERIECFNDRWFERQLSPCVEQAIENDKKPSHNAYIINKLMFDIVSGLDIQNELIRIMSNV